MDGGARGSAGVSALGAAMLPSRLQARDGNGQLKFVEWIEEEDGTLTLVAFDDERLHEFRGVDFGQVSREGAIGGRSLRFANLDVSRHATITCDCSNRTADLSALVGERVQIRCVWCSTRRRK
jgi:hypothetical protein